MLSRLRWRYYRLQSTAVVHHVHLITTTKIVFLLISKSSNKKIPSPAVLSQSTGAEVNCKSPKAHLLWPNHPPVTGKFP